MRINPYVAPSQGAAITAVEQTSISIPKSTGPSKKSNCLVLSLRRFHNSFEDYIKDFPIVPFYQFV